MGSQHVNAFVYAMALEENDIEKHQKLIALRLTSNEWERVESFLGLLAVCCTSICIFICHACFPELFSMLIKPSKHFRQTRCQHFTLEYLLSRHFTKHGHHGPKNQNMLRLLQHLQRLVIKWMSITRRQQTHRHTLWPCVCCRIVAIL